MGHVNIVASVIFSGMTGSAVADASGLGLMEIEAMKKDGYDAEFSCALTAASATVGPIFPPSIPLVIYAMLSGTSVGALFLGGVVPGLLIGLFLMGYVSWVSAKRNYPKGAVFTRKEFLAYTLKATPALITPIILLGGIYTGVVTPTEAGAVAALYSIIISIFAYKVMSTQKFIKTILDTVKATGMVGIMIGAASGISYIVTIENIPDQLAHIMLGVTDNKYIFLLIINVAFLILGMILDTSVLQLVFIPIVLPLVSQLGIDLVQFGVIFTLNTMIGLSTPPFGMLLFIVSGISDTDLKGVIKEAIPMVVVMIGVLVLITVWPDLVLYLPNKLMGN
jgi:tripartite ATP-independent transporter DctM subunit